MNFKAEIIEYTQTGYFSKIVTDYIAADPKLRSFYSHPVSVEGIKASIESRKKYNCNRQLLVSVLREQYRSFSLTQQQEENLKALEEENCFTICTAHQPNIFTGYLYFIYKVLHVIRLSELLKKDFPSFKFVPVYYMGSEDADLEELGQINLFGEKFIWKTSQGGAVGRMKVDKELINLIDIISGQLLVFEKGKELIQLLKECYKIDRTIEQATFQLVNELFRSYGLLILLPDNPDLKRAFLPVVKKELAEGFSNKAVDETVTELSKSYKAKPNGRELNLFYIKDDKRERIIETNSKFRIQNFSSDFDSRALLTEVEEFPDRLSPNVVLRPVFQEMILPNIVFIGGGGEIAYWLQLRKVFEKAGVPFPLMVVRNSFLIINEVAQNLLQKLEIKPDEIFYPEPELLNRLVKRRSILQVSLEKEKQQLNAFYQQLKGVPAAIDKSLETHTMAIANAAMEKLEALEKKMLRAEKRKFEAESRQLRKLKALLFPDGELQERVDNFMPYYAKWGSEFISMIYENSLGLEQKFVMVREE